MHIEQRKAYEAPCLLELGSLSKITQGGGHTNSDASPFVANTAFGPEELAS